MTQDLSKSHWWKHHATKPNQVIQQNKLGVPSNTYLRTRVIVQLQVLGKSKSRQLQERMKLNEENLEFEVHFGYLQVCCWHRREHLFPCTQTPVNPHPSYPNTEAFIVEIHQVRHYTYKWTTWALDTELQQQAKQRHLANSKWNGRTPPGEWGENYSVRWGQLGSDSDGRRWGDIMMGDIETWKVGKTGQ